jgi:hypothetical protein
MTEKRKQSKLREYITRVTGAKSEAEILSAEQAFQSYINLALSIAQRSLDQEDNKSLDE